MLPRLGKLVANDAEAYRYLAESIRMHPDQESLKQMMEHAGLERVEYFNLAAGVVALHRGYKILTRTWYSRVDVEYRRGTGMFSHMPTASSQAGTDEAKRFM